MRTRSELIAHWWSGLDVDEQSVARWVAEDRGVMPVELARSLTQAGLLADQSSPDGFALRFAIPHDIAAFTAAH